MEHLELVRAWHGENASGSDAISHVSGRGFGVISLPTDAGRDCTLRATCIQKTTCSDLSQIKYGRWSSALHGTWGVYWLPRGSRPPSAGPRQRRRLFNLAIFLHF